MKIYSIQNQYNPNFNSWTKTVYKQVGAKTVDNIQHRNTTSFYRRDLDWPNLTKFLVEKYKNTNKVNVYCYGCSNGSEPYTFLMQLCSNWPENISKKFLPIMAKDYDKEAIAIAKEGKIPVSNEELNVIQMATNNKLENFLDYVGHIDYDEKIFDSNHWIMKYNKNHAKNIEYSVADIRDDWSNINPQNSVIFARNFWPYLPESNILDLASKLGNHLKKGSCLIVGNFDNYGLEYQGLNLRGILYSNGFINEDENLKHVYTKL